MLSEFMKKDMTRIRNKSAFVNGIIDRVHKELAHDKVLMYFCRLLRSLTCFSEPSLCLCRFPQMIASVRSTRRLLTCRPVILCSSQPVSYDVPCSLLTCSSSRLERARREATSRAGKGTSSMAWVIMVLLEA